MTTLDKAGRAINDGDTVRLEAKADIVNQHTVAIELGNGSTVQVPSKSVEVVARKAETVKEAAERGASGITKAE